MEKQQMDKTKYLESKKHDFSDQKIIELIEDDLEYGLSDREIDDYTTRGLEYEQMQIVSEMHRKKLPNYVIVKIGATGIDAERMRLALELYDNGISIDEIEQGLDGCKTAHDMRLMFAKTLMNVQAVLAVPAEQMEKDIRENRDVPDYVENLIETLRGVVEKINIQENRCDEINQKLQEIETVRRDQAKQLKLEAENNELNETIEKQKIEIAELSEQLSGKQDEITKGLQSMSLLRNDVENGKEEQRRMQEEINRLKEEKVTLEETVREQGQAILSKNALLAKAGDNIQEKSEKEQTIKDTIDTDKPDAQSGTEKIVYREQENYQRKQIHQKSGIPVYYAMTYVSDGIIVDRQEFEYTKRRQSVFSTIMSRFASKKKSRRNLMELVINKELTADQVNEIKVGLEKGLDEEQLELIINKDLSAERIRSIVGFAALQNSLKAGGVMAGES